MARGAGAAELGGYIRLALARRSPQLRATSRLSSHRIYDPPPLFLVMSSSAEQLNTMIIKHVSEQYTALQEDPRVVSESSEDWEAWRADMGRLQVSFALLS